MNILPPVLITSLHTSLALHHCNVTFHVLWFFLSCLLFFSPGVDSFVSPLSFSSLFLLPIEDTGYLVGTFDFDFELMGKSIKAFYSASIFTLSLTYVIEMSFPDF